MKTCKSIIFVTGENIEDEGRYYMNIYYAKTVLYAYPHVEAIMEQIDELVERKALFSINDYSPCIEIAQKILDFTAQKDVFILIKLFCDKALRKFTDEEKDCFDYKYFKIKPKDYYENFDAESRGYFRRQVVLAKKFADTLEKLGATDRWFEENCLKIDFFKEMYKRVLEHEKSSLKNKPKKDKQKRNDKEKEILDKKKLGLSA